MKCFQGILISVILSVVLIQHAVAVQENARVINAGGGVSGNASYISFGAIGQGCPAGFIQNADHLAGSGFYASFAMFTNLDNNSNGICDEFDPDDDSDGIPDAVELAGTMFDPICPTDMMNADSNGDGINDYWEAMNGMDPVTPCEVKISRLELRDGHVVLHWDAHGNSTYKVLCGKSLSDLDCRPEMVHTVTVPDVGMPVVEFEFTDPCSSEDCGFFKIKRIKVNGQM